MLWSRKQETTIYSGGNPPLLTLPAGNPSLRAHARAGRPADDQFLVRLDALRAYGRETVGTITELPRDVDQRMEVHERLCAQFIDRSWSTRTSDDTDAVCATLHELGITLLMCTNRLVAALGGIRISDGS